MTASVPYAKSKAYHNNITNRGTLTHKLLLLLVIK